MVVSRCRSGTALLHRQTVVGRWERWEVCLPLGGSQVGVKVGAGRVDEMVMTTLSETLYPTPRGNP